MFRKGRVRSDGATEQDHSDARKRIEQRLARGKAKTKADAPAGSSEPEFPDALDYLWEWFWDALDGCPANGMVPVSIGWCDLSAWCELTGERLEPWEARLILRLSSLRSGIIAEVNDRQDKDRTA